MVTGSRLESAAADNRNAEKGWSVAVFANNEENGIVDCLRSLIAAGGGSALQVYVLANGCTDRTAAVARAYAREQDGIEVIEIAMGDKANAWNVYVHDLAVEAQYHFFIDGDTTPCPDSFRRLANSLCQDEKAFAASGLPTGGRTSVRWAQHIRARHGMPGPLYCIRGPVIDELRERRLRLPVGLIGDDVLIPFLIKRDLGDSVVVNPDRVHVCNEAQFTAPSLHPGAWRDWKTYWKRLRRNSLRRFQNQLLLPFLKKNGVSAIPERVEELYTEAAVKQLSIRLGVNTAFDWLARREIQRLVTAQRDRSAKECG